jgi:hypothetical protein
MAFGTRTLVGVSAGAFFAACGGRVLVDDSIASSTEASSGVGATTSAMSATTGQGGAHSGGAQGSGGDAPPIADPCQIPIGTRCDAINFPECPYESVDGIPCCYVTIICAADVFGVIAYGASYCTDNCDQSCALATDPGQCDGLGWCAWSGAGCVPTQ